MPAPTARPFACGRVPRRRDRHLDAKLFGTVAYIVHVASVDAHLANVDDRPERDLQAEWLKGELGAPTGRPSLDAAGERG